ncbi:MAG: mechanosensitive ion channel family protein, partial [Microcoleus sp. SIO2G3]|nr:mechanosensitive ion channel family protein [Microcoleus sp. SIO2G3]
MFKIRFSSWTIIGAIAFTSWAVSPVKAQLPSLQDLNLQAPNLLNQDQNDQVVSGCIRLDGRCLVDVAAPKSDINNRIKDINKRLSDISNTYFKDDKAQIEVYQQQRKGKNILNIYISVGDRQVRLMSVTNQDASLKDVDIDTRANELVEELEAGLKRAKQERRREFLTRQAGVAVGTGVAMLVITLALSRLKHRSKRSKDQLASSESSPSQPISTQLTQQQQWNVKEVQHRFFQLAQVGILGGGTLFILGLFPYTRMIQVLIIAGLRIPLRLGIAGLAIYMIIRLSFALIDRFASALASNYLLTPEANRRIQLRVSTVSRVTKGIVTISWIVLGTLVALSAIGAVLTPIA